MGPSTISHEPRSAPRPRSALQPRSGDELATAGWEALGSSVVLRLTDPSALEAARAATERELDAIDRACSRFRADSELARVNAGAGRPVRVSALMLEAVEVALRAARLTDGAVDPTLGVALELAGYDRDWRLLAPPGEGSARRYAISVSARPGWRAVGLDRARASVRAPIGVRLDLGATAKALAADRAASAAAEVAGCGVLVALGGDIATSGPAPLGGWQIRVTDDHRSDPSAPGQTISIRSGALATSSTAVRRWSHNGSNMHHIIDPRDGAPVRATWRTVSVAAASCTDANTATTAALVKADLAPPWLAASGLPARLLDWDGNVTTIGDWPTAQ